MSFSRRFGPGLLVTAAFIGPGTVTTATVAGAQFGFALLWAVAFSAAATIVLQEMSARLGLVTRNGLGEAVRATVTRPIARTAAAGVIVTTLVLGNSFFEIGNVSGAALGLEALAGGPRWMWTLIVGAGALVVLASRRFRVLEAVLIGLVAMMSAVFILTALKASPNLRAVAAGFVGPSIPEASLTTIVALIGTTVVPYNLFLHASAAREKWPDSVPTETALREARWDSALAIALGGIITAAILVTAAACLPRGTPIQSAGDMAVQLKPLLGRWAKCLFAVGLLAAGFSSAITAPLAAAYATCGVLGWDRSQHAGFFAVVWGFVLAVGTAFGVMGVKPVEAIIFAQAANGLLLPLVALFLLAAVNNRKLLGRYANGGWANVLGAIVFLTVLTLSLFQIVSAIAKLGRPSP